MDVVHLRDSASSFFPDVKDDQELALGHLGHVVARFSSCLPEQVFDLASFNLLLLIHFNFHQNRNTFIMPLFEQTSVVVYAIDKIAAPGSSVPLLDTFELQYPDILLQNISAFILQKMLLHLRQKPRRHDFAAGLVPVKHQWVSIAHVLELPHHREMRILRSSDELRSRPGFEVDYIWAERNI